MTTEKFIPIRVELDLADENMTPEMARYIKNLTFFQSDTSEVSNNVNGKAGKYRPLESTTVFDSGFVFPSGYNHFIGAYPCIEENCVLFHYYNSNGFHFIGRIMADSQTVDMVYRGSCQNYQLQPQHFIHEGAGYVEAFKYNDEATGEQKRRSYYNFTDGFNDARFICVEDSIATNSFDETMFPYFQNPHNKCYLINAGVPKPKGCIKIASVPNDDPSKQNNLRFNTWQFMVRYIDVYGRPSEWGDMSDVYVPGENDCIGSSNLIPRCVDLTFDAGYPLVNIVEVAFRNCNDPQWYIDTSLFLYRGTNFGDWWLRPRNPDVNFNPSTNEITYRFCKDKECNPVPQDETNRTQNPLPRTTQTIAKIGKFLSLQNNLHGFFPFSDEVMDDITVSVSQPQVGKKDELATIEIYVPVWNAYIDTYQPVYEIGGDQWVFGGRKDFSNDYVNGIFSDYRMGFGDLGRRGFIGYIAGTGTPPSSTVSEMYYVNDDNELVKVEDFSIIHQPVNPSTNPFNPIEDYRRKYYHKFTFNNVMRAQYVFRIAGHMARLADKNFYTTSTYVAGSYTWANKAVNFGSQVSNAKELVIDVCDNDYSSLNDNKVLVIWDMTEPRNDGSSRSKIVAGYVYEKKEDDVFQIPIELLNTNIYGDDARNGHITDHNGFYFGSVRRDNAFNNEIFGMCSCAYKSLIRFRIDSNFNGLHERTFDLQGYEDSTCKDYAVDLCNRILIKGRVVECDTGIGVSNVGVTLTRGAFTITNADGEFTIIAHDDTRHPTLTRFDSLLYAPSTCRLVDCDGDCIDKNDIVIQKCTTGCALRELIVPDREVLFEEMRGLLSGGNYGVAIWGNDWLGRHGFAQVRDKLYFTIPSIIQSKAIAPSTVTLNIPPSVTFPSWVDEISIGITKELAMGGIYLSWIVDRVVFIDNTGNENTIAPTQIKVYYASLNEYNVQNNFNTTTHWQFMVQAVPQINYTSDYVEFYINGDGNYFPTLTRALIKYDQAGQYFLIDYDPALKDLQQYALIRLGRPQVCATKDAFYQLCGTVKVRNGKAVQNTIRLSAFDTYYKYRQIPIPIETGEDQTENVLRSFGFPFEHHSPSDFWGDHCINIGKVNVRNPYEAEIIRENQFAVSGAMSVNGQLNYLNYFDEKLTIDVDSWDFGGITSVIPFVSGVYVICAYNCFVMGFNDNILRVNKNGQVEIPSADSRFGNPEVKIGSHYGCSLFDKNTIRKKDGWVQFLDTREGGLIQSSFGNDAMVSRRDDSKGIVGGIDSWLRAKIKYIQNYNLTHTDKKYFHGTINPAARVYMLSDFTIRSTDFVNEERGMAIEQHETVAFDYLNKFFRQFLSETPQGFSYMEGQGKDLQLFLFADKIYTHYSTSPNKTYNNIFGTVVNRVIRPVVVIDKMQKKKFDNVTVMGKHLYFADQVLTESNQRSRILKAAFRQGDFYWGAPVLCNLDTPVDSNTPEKSGLNLLDGQKMYGSILDIRFIGNPDDDNVLTELVGLAVEVEPEGKVLS